MTISLQNFPILDQTITSIFKKKPKYCYRLIPKHVPLSKKLQPQLQNLRLNLRTIQKSF
jgi:hypothetical protein